MGCVHRREKHPVGCFESRHVIITSHVPACHILLALCEESIEEDQDHEGGVVGDGCLDTAELALVMDVEPSAEQHNSSHAVQGGLQQQGHQVKDCEGVPLCPVPVIY